MENNRNDLRLVPRQVSENTTDSAQYRVSADKKKPDEVLVVGLGNPGREYEYTRHNLGFLVLCYLADRFKGKFKSTSWAKGALSEIQIEDQRIFLLMPMTFMNHSGLAVKQFLGKHPIGLDKMLVVCDDLSLEFGRNIYIWWTPMTPEAAFKELLKPWNNWGTIASLTLKLPGRQSTLSSQN